METKQTTLQRIVEKKTDQIRAAIEQAIDKGAKIERKYAIYVTIDNIFLQKNDYCNGVAIVLTFKSEKISQYFKPSKENLIAEAKKKRKELEEIEQQLKEMEV